MPHRTCSTQECEAKHYARGLCRSHYDKVWVGRKPNVACAECGTLVYRAPSRRARSPRSYCSPECRAAAGPHYAGPGRRWAEGYIQVKRPNHPHAYLNGWIMEHRVVMEDHIGRLLRRDEQVHHINGDRADNRIENLIVMDQGAHLREHRAIWRDLLALTKENQELRARLAAVGEPVSLI